mgnify:CR=1 FL=1
MLQRTTITAAILLLTVLVTRAAESDPAAEQKRLAIPLGGDFQPNPKVPAFVVVGHGAERVTKKVQEEAPPWAHVTFVEQTVQRGTGDAANVGLSAFPGVICVPFPWLLVTIIL